MVKNVMIQAEDAQSSQVLLRRFAANGDDDAFRILVSRYIDFVYSVCRRELGTPEEAQDVAQEVFVVLASRAKQLRKDTVLPAWLFKVAVNQCRMARRKESRRRKLEEKMALGSNSAPEFALDGVLAGLSDQDRSVLVLRFLQDLSIREVAQSVGVTEDTARMRINRALAKLRRRVGYAAVLAPLPMESAVLPVKTIQYPHPSYLHWFPLAASVGAVVIGTSLLSGTVRIGPALDRISKFWGARSANELSVSLLFDQQQSLNDLLPITAKVEVMEGGKAVFSGETWRSKEVTRFRSIQMGHLTEAEIKGGVARTMVDPHNNPGPNVGSIIISPDTRRVVETDLFELALLELPRYLHVEKGLTATPIPNSKQEGPIKVTVDGNRIYTVWLDPAHRNLAKKVGYKIDNFQFEFTVEKWLPLSGTRWVPARVEIKGWFQNHAQPVRTAVISNVKLGSDVHIPPMPVPRPGSMVMDEFKHTIYRIDAKWNRISEERKVGNGNLGGK